MQRIADPATSTETTAELFTGIGRIEAAEGRSLEPLQAALRLGARVTWRTLCEQAVQGSLSVGVIGPVGEALFLYIDELAAACAEGFTRAARPFGLGPVITVDTTRPVDVTVLADEVRLRLVGSGVLPS